MNVFLFVFFFIKVPGIFSNIYNWFVNKKTSWFGGDGGWFQGSVKAKKPNYIFPTTTTPEPLTPAPSWFHTLVESEENDGAYASELSTSKYNALHQTVRSLVNIKYDNIVLVKFSKTYNSYIIFSCSSLII